MAPGYLAQALAFLIEVGFGLYIFAVLLRLIFQFVRADFYNPISQAIVSVTNPVLTRLRRFVPAMGNIDTASVLLLIALQTLALLLVSLVYGLVPALPGLVFAAIAALVTKTLYIFIGAILIMVVASWVAPGGYSPALRLVSSLAEPLLAPLRRSLPPLGGLDLSPLVALVLLQLSLILIVGPLKDVARAFS